MECSQTRVHSIANQYDPYHIPDDNLDMMVLNMIDFYQKPNILFLSYMKIRVLLIGVK